MAACLLGLPHELLAPIFEGLIHEYGIRAGVKLRRVSTEFNVLVLDAVYSLPTFDNVDEAFPAHLTWDPRMSTSMVEGIIRTRLESKTQHRELPKAILSTVEFMMATIGCADKVIYSNALICLAARCLPIYEVLRGLSPNTHDEDLCALQSTRPMSDTAEMVENALNATLFLDRPLEVEILQRQGAKGVLRTKWFGDALAIAACYADVECFTQLAVNILGRTSQNRPRLAASRLSAALERAAFIGRTNVFSAQLWHNIGEHALLAPSIQLFGPAARSAALASHEETLVEIISTMKLQARRRRATLQDLPVNFWTDILPVAASNGCGKAVQLILLETNVAHNAQNLILPIEDACRSNQCEIVELLFAHQPECDLVSHAGVLFWAARHCNHKILMMIFQKSESFGRISLDALAGASIHGTPAMVAVLKSMMRSDNSESEPVLLCQGTTFADVVDEIGTSIPLGEVESSTLQSVFDEKEVACDIFDELLSADQRRLIRACSYCDVEEVRRVIARHSREDGLEGNFFSGASSECICQQRPGLLQYLCEKLATVKYFATSAIQCVRSTSILQVLTDYGWTTDTGAGSRGIPLLGTMTCSDELTRWFLDHGADPNVRCDWDITPLSVCIRDAPLSTVFLLLRHAGDVRRGQQLRFAIQRTSLDQLAIIDMLLSFGTNINARMYEDDEPSWLENQAFGMGTALHQAVELGNEDVVAILLGRGALPSIQDSAGRTALDIAKEKDWRGIIELIENAPGTENFG